MADGKPGRGSDQFPLRLPDGMRDALKAAAALNNRSMNSEIVSRLERYDSLSGEVGAMVAVAEGIAEEVDRLSQRSASDVPLAHMVTAPLSSVAEDGTYDHAQIARHYSELAKQRLPQLPDGPPSYSDEVRETLRIIGLYLTSAKFATSPIKSIVVLPPDAPLNDRGEGPVPEDFAPDEVLYLPQEEARVVPAKPRKRGKPK